MTNSVDIDQKEPLEQEEFLRQIKSAALRALDTEDPLAHYVAYWGFIAALKIHKFDTFFTLELFQKLRSEGHFNDNESLRQRLINFAL